MVLCFSKRKRRVSGSTEQSMIERRPFNFAMKVISRYSVRFATPASYSHRCKRTYRSLNSPCVPAGTTVHVLKQKKMFCRNGTPVPQIFLLKESSSNATVALSWKSHEAEFSRALNFKRLPIYCGFLATTTLFYSFRSQLPSV